MDTVKLETLDDSKQQQKGQKPSCVFFKKSNVSSFKSSKFNKKNVRRPQIIKEKDTDGDDDSDDDREGSGGSSSDDETQVRKKEMKKKKNPLVQSTSSFSGLKKRKFNKTGDDNCNDSSESDDNHKASLHTVSYKSSRTSEPELPKDMGATATIEYETEVSKDARTIYEKSLKINEELKEKGDDKIYRGVNNYQKFITPKDSILGSAMSSEVAKGPVRAPSNIRSTVRWDYKPDLCKDYKETGFCGFGDSCIFLHDRTDYKSGWQIELEYDKGQYGKDDEDSGKYEIKDDETIPFKCLICRSSFKNPIITKCKHYFCEKCALSHYKKSTRCFVCDTQTQGIFNPAKEIIRKLSQKKIQRDEENDTHSDGDDEDDQVDNDEDDEHQAGCSHDHHPESSEHHDDDNSKDEHNTSDPDAD